jgi:hypothetical protein
MWLNANRETLKQTSVADAREAQEKSEAAIEELIKQQDEQREKAMSEPTPVFTKGQH